MSEGEDLTSSQSSEEVEACGAQALMCVCTREPGHAGPHVCNNGMCGGQWNGVYGEDSFEVVVWPGSNIDFLNVITDAIMSAIGRPPRGRPPGYEER